MNYVPIIGWFVSVLVNMSLAFPFWFLWTYLGAGSRYFTWLPSIWHKVPYWDLVGLFVLVHILYDLIAPIKLNFEKVLYKANKK